MKKVLFSAMFVFWGLTSFSQWFGDDYYDLTFDNPSILFHLIINTASNHNNLWQVGKPNKTDFTNAYSVPKAIVTDTLNPYPVNDTSSFIIKNVAYGHGFDYSMVAILAGQYYVNSDTLKDFGKIEFSPDNGLTWKDLLKDSVLVDTINNFFWHWDNQKPTLSGNSKGWQNFWVNLAPLGHLYGVQDFDTILYRFTFISDSLQTNKDGLMFDNFHFEDWIEGINEIQLNHLVSLSPNPFTTSTQITLDKGCHNISLAVYDIQGKLMLQKEYADCDRIQLSRNGLDNGMYFLKLTLDDRWVETGKIVVGE